MTKHALMPGQGEEFTVCGLSHDAFESGDHDEPVQFATYEQRITCPDCVDLLNKIQDRFKRTPSGNWRVIE